MMFKPCRSERNRSKNKDSDLLQKTASVDSTIERKMQLFDTNSSSKARINYHTPLLAEMANAAAKSESSSDESDIMPMEKAIPTISPQNSNLFLGTVEEADNETEASSSSGDEMDEPQMTKTQDDDEAFQTRTNTATSSVCSTKNRLPSTPSHEFTTVSCVNATTTGSTAKETQFLVVQAMKDDDDDIDNDHDAGVDESARPSEMESHPSAVAMENESMQQPDENKQEKEQEAEQNPTIARNDSHKSSDEASITGSVPSRKSAKSTAATSIAGSVDTRKSLKSILLTRKYSTAESVASVQDSVALAHKRGQVPGTTATTIDDEKEIDTATDTVVKNESMTSKKKTDYISMVRKISICEERTIMGLESKEEDEEKEDRIIDINDDAEDATIETAISRQDSMAVESTCSKKSILSRRSTSSRRSTKSVSRAVPLSRVCKSMPIIPMARKGSKLGSIVTRFATARNAPSDPAHALSPVAEEGSKRKEITSSGPKGKTDLLSAQSSDTEMVIGVTTSSQNMPTEDLHSSSLENHEGKIDYGQKNDALCDETVTVSTVKSQLSSKSKPLDVEEIKNEILLARKDSTASMKNAGSFSKSESVPMEERFHSHEKCDMMRKKSLLGDENCETKSVASIRRKESRDATNLVSRSFQHTSENASIVSQDHSRTNRLESAVETTKPRDKADLDVVQQNLPAEYSTAPLVSTPKHTNTETTQDLESHKSFIFSDNLEADIDVCIGENGDDVETVVSDQQLVEAMLKIYGRICQNKY